MSIQRILEAMVLVPILVIVILSSVDTLMPLYKYSDLKAICYQYNQILINEGVLSQEQITALKDNLEAKGLKNIAMSLPAFKEWGDSYTFEVTGDFTQEKRNIDLSKKVTTHSFRYKRTGLSLKGGD